MDPSLNSSQKMIDLVKNMRNNSLPLETIYSGVEAQDKQLFSIKEEIKPEEMKQIKETMGVKWVVSLLPGLAM